jgi:DNA-binding PadR family transcriptional regulator
VPERITQQLLLVLGALMADPGRRWYGMELMECTQLTSGTVYPILRRLVEAGWLVCAGEVPSDAGGAGRRLYALTGDGERAASAVLADRVPGRLASQPGRR